MRKYYYLAGQDRVGPLTLEELKSVVGFSAATLVWYQGLSGWTRAGDVSELSGVFTSVPPMPPVPPNPSEQKLFAHPFSFKGRIRRLEYGLSSVIGSCVAVLTFLLLGGSGSLIAGLVSFLISTVIYWFVFAQGSKRCHDIGKRGWWQLIPFYNLYVLFAEGDRESNKYGCNPKLNSSISDSQKKGYIAAGIIIELIALVFMLVSMQSKFQGLGLTPAEREELLEILKEEYKGESQGSSPSVSVTGIYSGGAGTVESPYLISSRSDMELLSKNVNAGHMYEDTCFLLTRDLTGASDIVTTVIGRSVSIEELNSSMSENDFEFRYFAGVFAGVFDGGGHEITVNIWVSVVEGYAGIFSFLKGATVKDLRVGGQISGTAYAGGICGFALGATRILNCSNRATVSGTHNVGGICGYIGSNYAESEISGCRNSGEIYISGKYGSSGGIVGFTGGNSELADCHNVGGVSTEGENVCAGGITGFFSLGRSRTGITRCSNRGSTVATGKESSNAGGIVGHLSMGEISDCYNCGEVSSLVVSGGDLSDHHYLSTAFSSGGIVGYSSGGSSVKNCYNLGDVRSSECTGGICGRLGGAIESCFSANAHAHSYSYKPDEIFGGGHPPGRIIGIFGAEDDDDISVSNVYALSSMLINGRSCDCDPSDLDSRDGLATSASSFKSQSWLSSELGWSFSIWLMPDDNSYPLLRSELTH